MAGVGKRILKGASYIFVFSILASVSGYFLRLLLARNLSVKDFGLFYSVFAFIGIFAIFKDLGLSSSLIKYVSEFKAKKQFDKIKSSFYYILIIQFFSVLFFSVIIFLFKDFLALNYFNDSRAAIVLIFMLGWFIISTFQDTIFFMFHGLQDFFMFSLRDFMKNTLPLILIIIFLFTGFDYKSPAISYFLAVILTTLIIVPFLLRSFKFSKYKFVKSFALVKKLFAFGFPMLLASLGGILIARMDTIMLTLFRSLEEVGIYNIALPTAGLFFVFGKSLASVFLPVSSELWAQNKKKELENYIFLMYKYLLIFALPFILTLFSFSGLFLRFFFGKEYVAGALTLQILLIGVFLYSFAFINNSSLAGVGRPKEITKIFLIAGVLNFILNLILIPPLGMVGAAIATTFTYIVIFILGSVKISKIVTLRSPVVMWLKTLFAGMIFLALTFVLRRLLVINPWLELIVFSSLSFIAYAGIILLLRVTTIGEFAGLVRSVLKK